jgi:hypothetical protein
VTVTPDPDETSTTGVGTDSAKVERFDDNGDPITVEGESSDEDD